MKSKAATIVWGVMVAGTVLTGCATFPASPCIDLQRKPDVIQEVMGRKNKIVLLSSQELRHDQPILLLLHGATDDPTEMMGIANEWAATHNVLLYSYNFHQPLEKVASDFLKEVSALKERMETIASENSPGGSMTVVNYSYSAIVFRKSVLLSDDRQLFAGTSLIQLVPTAGGSFLARGMRYSVVAWLVSLASEFSAAQNPYGRMAEELWGEGNKKFHEAIDPQRMHTFLVEGDSHSLAKVGNNRVLQRYRNGVGSNVVIIPKELGVTHDNFPNHPLVLAHLRKIIDSALDEERSTGSKAKAKAGADSLLATVDGVIHPAPHTDDASIR